MPNCTHPELTFPSFDRRKIEANFEGGYVSIDGGILLLREADRPLGLVQALDAALPDPRAPQLITHRQANLLRQRIYGLALGYEDLNDHTTLRQDLEALGTPLMAQAEAAFAVESQKQRIFAAMDYAADTWDRSRRVIAKAEFSAQGKNPRFLVTSLEGEPQALYDEVYCPRGEMENRIKEQQLGLFSDRISCHSWWANQFGVILSAAAYALMETIRRVGLRGTELARAQVGTIRLKLLKIGAVIVRNTRRIRLFFSSAYPHQDLFASVCTALSSA